MIRLLGLLSVGLVAAGTVLTRSGDVDLSRLGAGLVLAVAVPWVTVLAFWVRR